MKRIVWVLLFTAVALWSCGTAEINNASEQNNMASSVESAHLETSCESRETSADRTDVEETSVDFSSKDSDEQSIQSEVAYSSDASEEMTSKIEESSEESQEPNESSEENSKPSHTENIETNIQASEAHVILQQIEKIASEYKSVSIYYCDTSAGYFYSRNTEERYSSASVIKAFYCQYLLSEKVDMNRKIQLTEAKKTSSSGRLTKDAVGKWFAVKDLMKYAIRNSDNMAYYLLFKTYGKDGFNDYIKSLGLKEPRLHSIEYTTLGAESAALCMKEIWRYAEEMGDYFLVDLLKNTTHNKQISAGTEAEVAHKYGYQDGRNIGYHDVAIVYAEEPYILAICTREDLYDKESYKVFVKIAALTEMLHKYLH